jgi:hypothetical protein
MKNKRLLSNLDRVGKLLSAAGKRGRLAPVTANVCRKVLKDATKELFSIKSSILKESKKLSTKKAALDKSIKESLIDKKEGFNESRHVSKAAIKYRVRQKQVQASIDAVKRLASEINNLDSGNSKTMSNRTKNRRLSLSDKKRIAKRYNRKRAQGPEVYDTTKKARAKRLYLKAASFLEQSEKEKDVKKKASLKRRSAVMEKLADNVINTSSKPSRNSSKVSKSISERMKQRIAQRRKARKQNKTMSINKSSADVKAMYSVDDSVLLPDGVVGKINCVDNDKLTVSIAGVDKEVMADTVKKISDYNKDKKETDKKEKDKKEKNMSIADKVKAATEIIRSGSKKKADAPVAVVEDAPEETQEMSEESVGDTVSQTDNKTINYVDGLGWTVNNTDNEVINFGEDKEAAESYVKQAGILDSADMSEPEGRENLQKKMKGLTQKSKDYGTTSKDQEVNPQTSMVSKATSMTKDSPVDSATNKAPEDQRDIQKTLKGLDQKSMDYGVTSKEQEADPQLSVYARKNRILADANKKMNERLAIVEAKLLVDRAVKVGTISEEQRSDQERVLSELHLNSPAEFKAFSRLVETQEKNSSTVSVASRKVRKVKNSLENRKSVIVDPSDTIQTLDTGNFFDE